MKVPYWYWSKLIIPQCVSVVIWFFLELMNLPIHSRRVTMIPTTGVQSKGITPATLHGAVHAEWQPRMRIPTNADSRMEITYRKFPVKGVKIIRKKYLERGRGVELGYGKWKRVADPPLVNERTKGLDRVPLFRNLNTSLCQIWNFIQTWSASLKKLESGWWHQIRMVSTKGWQNV